jgi:predicted trehalose synthase
VTYEAANRPSWIGVPLAGLVRLAGRLSEKELGARHV